jgi:hypothetical protein
MVVERRHSMPIYAIIGISVGLVMVAGGVIYLLVEKKKNKK